jgi:serine/threonine protein kinase
MTNPRDAKNNYDPQKAGNGDAHEKIAFNQTIKVSQSPGASDANNFGVGQILAGKYKMISVLGRGGMGTVYHVQQVFLNIEMALKVLDFSQVSNASNLNRFAIEAKAAYALNHHTLVKVFDFGVLEQGQPYFAMEYIAGTTLADYLKKSGPLPLAIVAPIFSQIAEGLDYAHEHEVVHRDIKPGNIMLVKGTEYGAPGSVRIVDFGIAKTVMNGGIGEIQALTQTGEIFGSPLYMSPEQCSGSEIDYRTDVYSLGCTLFEALTGTPPYVGANQLRTMMLHTTGDTPSLTEASMGREFPRGLNQLVQKMLAKLPEDRYQKLWMMSKDLNDIIANKGASTGRSGEDQKARPKPGTNSVKAMVIASVAIGLVGICYYASLQFFDHANKREQQAGEKSPRGIEVQDAKARDGKAEDDNSRDSRVEKTEASNGEDTTMLTDQKAMENGYLQRLQKSQKAFAVAGPIASQIVGEGANKQRKIVFPDFEIGRVYNVKDGVISKLFVTAIGTKFLSPDGDLLLNTGGDYKEAFYSPTIFEAVDPYLFKRLVLSRPAYRLEFKDPPSESEITNKAASILAIASKWKVLTEVCLASITLNADALDALAHMKNLHTLTLQKCTEADARPAQVEFVNRLESLTLDQSNAPDMLLAITNSRTLQRLELSHLKVQAKYLDALATCSQLHELQLADVAYDGDVIAKIAKIKSLQSFSFVGTDVTSQQIQAVLKACPQIRSVLVARDIELDFQDARIRRTEYRTKAGPKKHGRLQ